MSISAKLIDALGRFRYTLLLCCILFFCCLISRASIKPMDVSSIVWTCINMSLFILLLYAFAGNFMRYPISIVLGLVAGLDIGLFYVYENPMHYSVLASIFETNASEALEVGSVAIPIGLISTIVLCFLMIKTTSEIRSVKIKWGAVLSIMVFLLILIALPLFLIQRDGFNVAFNMKKNPGITLSSAIGVKYPFVFNDFFLGALYIDEMVRLNSNADNEKVLPQGVAFKETTDINKIIYVIGESATHLNYSLYGYPIKTTPFLDSLATTKHLQYYRNVFSPVTVTRDAMRLTLTFATAKDPEPFYHNHSIVDLANSVGYETVWISNHSNFDIYNSYVDQVKSRAKFFHYTKNETQDDFDLMKFLEQRLCSGKRQFITIHLIGSHVKYETKYDKEDEMAIKETIADENIHYDRSIHHTDRILRCIYNQVKNLDEKVIIFYYSDHGAVFDTKKGASDRLDKHKVPLVVMKNYVEDSSLNTDSIIKKYYDEKTGIYSTMNNPYILSEMMGYQISDSAVESAVEDGLFILNKDGEVIPILEMMKNKSSSH